CRASCPRGGNRAPALVTTAQHCSIELMLVVLAVFVSHRSAPSFPVTCQQHRHLPTGSLLNPQPHHNIGTFAQCVR
ncbi:MAG: hypothetical protein KDB72_24500, partial [Mycobacterium sp.]|nr:hypothetical protein [Mycobacterium sp.]